MIGKICDGSCIRTELFWICFFLLSAAVADLVRNFLLCFVWICLPSWIFTLKEFFRENAGCRSDAVFLKYRWRVQSKESHSSRRRWFYVLLKKIGCQNFWKCKQIFLDARAARAIFIWQYVFPIKFCCSISVQSHDNHDNSQQHHHHRWKHCPNSSASNKSMLCFPIK